MDTLVRVIDVRDELFKNKSAHVLYYKTDNHWNDIGGYYAYRKVVTEIHKDFEMVNAVEASRLVLDSLKPLIGGEAQLLNVGEIYNESKYDYNPGPRTLAHPAAKKGYPSPEGFMYAYDFEIVMETNNVQLPDALIIRDSFGDALLPFLAESFNRSVFIFDSWYYGPNREIVKEEKPEIVLCMVMESNLESLLKNE
jgi:hypothetical protein